MQRKVSSDTEIYAFTYSFKTMNEIINPFTAYLRSESIVASMRNIMNQLALIKYFWKIPEALFNGIRYEEDYNKKIIFPAQTDMNDNKKILNLNCRSKWNGKTEKNVGKNLIKEIVS